MWLYMCSKAIYLRDKGQNIMKNKSMHCNLKLKELYLWKGSKSPLEVKTLCKRNRYFHIAKAVLHLLIKRCAMRYLKVDEALAAIQTHIHNRRMNDIFKPTYVTLNPESLMAEGLRSMFNLFKAIWDLKCVDKIECSVSNLVPCR